MVNPKITPGEWYVDSYGRICSKETYDCVDDRRATNVDPTVHLENTKAIVMLPQLLAIYKTEKELSELLNTHFPGYSPLEIEFRKQGLQDRLRKEIEVLEEKYAKIYRKDDK